MVLNLLLIVGCSGIRRVSTPSVEEKNGLYQIRMGNQVLEIDPISGAKISALRIDGSNFLTDKTVHKTYWGSSFWISPEAVWDWSEKEIDDKPYSSAIQGGKVVLTSPKSVKTGLVVTKTFSAIKENNSFVVEYTIINESDQVKDLAPWEVTRVQTEGIAFFPFGEGSRRGGLLPFTVEKDGISWYQYRAEDVPLKGNRQLYSDGSEGWLAQVNNGVILIKKFEDIPFDKNAPQEGEVEWYASPAVAGKSYVEIEHQGAYTHLLPGQSLTWRSEWILRKLPADIVAGVGNAKLVEYVRRIVK